MRSGRVSSAWKAHIQKIRAKWVEFFSGFLLTLAEEEGMPEFLDDLDES